jgi:hypothetical protein
MTLEPLSPTTAVFLLADHQTGVFERVVKAPPREQVEANVARAENVIRAGGGRDARRPRMSGLSP